jgi:dTMP kinase
MKAMTNQLFITFEGPDGGGKTTQIARLASYIKDLGYEVVLTREPGGTVISDKIRSLLLDPAHQELNHETEVLLYAASRAQHVREVIIPALDQGKVVLCDRFVDASLAYQGYGLGITLESIAMINHFATGGLKPTRTYLLEIPLQESIQRMMARQGLEFSANLDRIEQREQEFHLRVRKGFEIIYNENDQRMVKINGAQPIDHVFEDIRLDFMRLIGESR